MCGCHFWYQVTWGRMCCRSHFGSSDMGAYVLPCGNQGLELRAKWHLAVTSCYLLAILRCFGLIFTGFARSLWALSLVVAPSCTSCCTISSVWNRFTFVHSQRFFRFYLQWLLNWCVVLVLCRRVPQYLHSWKPCALVSAPFANYNVAKNRHTEDDTVVSTTGDSRNCTF